MRALQCFIIDLPKKFKDKIKMGDKELDLVSKFNEFENRVMEATIVATPAKYKTDAKPGDTLYFHHSIVMNNTLKLEDGKYMVPFIPGAGRSNLGHAYKNEDGIHMIDEWVFLEPMESTKKLTSDVVEIVQKEVQNNRGRVWANSPALSEENLSIGDVVYFKKNADYEMEIDGKKVWRMTMNELLYAEVK